jgi:hypothetical protein
VKSSASAWYEELRNRYRPDRIRLLLIGESPPDPGSAERRFFYSPKLSHDNLYRGVAAALYGTEQNFVAFAKPMVLDRLRADGVWLIDAVDHPIDKQTSAARRREIRNAAPGLVARVREIDPEVGVLICHSVVYEHAAPSLNAAGMRVLHDRPIPFPLGNWRAQFVTDVRAALANAGW